MGAAMAQKVSEQDLVEIADELAMRATDKEGSGSAAGRRIQRRLEKAVDRDGLISTKTVEALFLDYGLPVIMAVEFCGALGHNGTGRVDAQEVFGRITEHLQASAGSGARERKGVAPPPTPPRST